MPSFTAKVAIKVASFKKGANKVITKLSLKKSVNKKDTLVERLNAIKRATAATEDAEQITKVTSVALAQQSLAKAALVDALLESDQDTIYLRPSCSPRGSFDDDDDEDDKPASVWESASSSFTTHHTISSSFLPSLALDFADDEDEDELPLAVPIYPLSKRYLKFTTYDCALPILDEEEEDDLVANQVTPILPLAPPPAPALIAIVAPKPVPASQINTIPFPVFQNASFDSLLLAEQMGIHVDGDCPYLYYAGDSDASLESRLRTPSPPFAGGATAAEK